MSLCSQFRGASVAVNKSFVDIKCSTPASFPLFLDSRIFLLSAWVGWLIMAVVLAAIIAVWKRFILTSIPLYIYPEALISVVERGIRMVIKVIS